MEFTIKARITSFEYRPLHSTKIRFFVSSSIRAQLPLVSQSPWFWPVNQLGYHSFAHFFHILFNLTRRWQHDSYSDFWRRSPRKHFSRWYPPGMSDIFFHISQSRFPHICPRSCRPQLSWFKWIQSGWNNLALHYCLNFFWWPVFVCISRSVSIFTTVQLFWLSYWALQDSFSF